ncbi:MAG: hypothetical protein JSW23_06400 [Planctomycetota bacterium]|nr:MAG: hypothetical protein JSW23_06400 [Planctomycetota bacterium]
MALELWRTAAGLENSQWKIIARARLSGCGRWDLERVRGGRRAGRCSAGRGGWGGLLTAFEGNEK